MEAFTRHQDDGHGAPKPGRRDLEPFGLNMPSRTGPDPRYKIGQEYTPRGRAKRLCRVIDIHRTYNAAGELVRVRYVSQHSFMGQTITDSDVCETTIAIALAG